MINCFIMGKTVVIGAGPAGLTAAYELLKQTSDTEIIVLEESDVLGGISKTVNYKGNRMDMGGHRFFSKDARVNEWSVYPGYCLTGNFTIIRYLLSGKLLRIWVSEIRSGWDFHILYLFFISYRKPTLKTSISTDSGGSCIQCFLNTIRRICGEGSRRRSMHRGEPRGLKACR